MGSLGCGDAGEGGGVGGTLLVKFRLVCEVSWICGGVRG